MSIYSTIETARRTRSEMDDKIGRYSEYLETVSDGEGIHLQSKLLNAKVMKEMLVAMNALAKAQSILSEMDVLIAEHNLKTAVDKLKKYSDAEKKTLAHEQKTSKPKQTEIDKSPATDELEQDSQHHQRIPSPTEDEKENLNTAEKNKPIQLHESFRINTSDPQTPSEKHKRKHSSSSSSKSQTEKKIKRTCADTFKSTERKLSSIMKPKSKLTVTKGVQTCRNWFEQIKRVQTCSETPEAKNIGNVSQIIDDENTVVLEQSEASHTHKDAINLSKALQQLMLPKMNTVKHDSTIADLPNIPVSSNIQLLFEDEPKKSKKNCSKVKVKSVASDADLLNTSTDNLVNGLFRDIMKAKLKDVTSESSSSISNNSVMCKDMLRQLLEQC